MVKKLYQNEQVSKENLPRELLPMCFLFQPMLCSWDLRKEKDNTEYSAKVHVQHPLK